MQMKLNVQFTASAWAEYSNWVVTDKKAEKNIFKLIKDIQRDPFDGLGKPEPLVGNLTGFWSRKIDSKNRIVYGVDSNGIHIIQVKGHYTDK